LLHLRKSSGGLGSPRSELQLHVRAPVDGLDGAVRGSGWLKRLGVKAGSWDGLKQWVAERWDEVVEAAVRRLGGDAREELEALKGRLKDDKVAREAIAPALLLIQAEKLGVNEESLSYFGAAISGAVGGDGHVSAALERVELASGERGIALLWGAAFKAYGIKAEVEGAGTAFKVVTSGGDAVRLAGLYFLFGPPLLEGGDERVINHKLAEAVELGAEGALNIRWEGLRRRTEDGPVAADLTISEGGVEVKYNAYLRDDTIVLQFQSTDRSRAELAARLLKRAGVTAEVKKVGDRDEWHVYAYTDRLAAGYEKLRKILAEIVKTALARGWVDEKKARRWLEKLEGGLTLREGWPKYEVGLAEGALVIRYSSTNPGNIEREAQRLRAMGLVEDIHFTVKMPEGGKAGYVSILREGLAYAAWLSVHGSGDAAKFVEYILQRAGDEGKDVYRKVLEVVKEGKAWSSLTLKGFEKRVEVTLKLKGPDGTVKEVRKTYDVKVIDGGAELKMSRRGRKLLRLRITAEVDGIRNDYTITFGRYGANAALGFAAARADAPGGREADAERLSALIKALTGREPNVYRKSNGKIEIECYEGQLEGFMLYKEFFGTIMQWLKDTSRRGRGADRQGAEDAPQEGPHDNDKA